jgi:hypothetical protein
LLGEIREAAASAPVLTKAGYRPRGTSACGRLLASVVAALTGKAFIGETDALAAIFARALVSQALVRQALAGGAVLALDAMP